MAISIHLICVGPLKDSNLKQFEQEYLKRLTSIKLSIHEVKSNGDSLEKEGIEVLNKINEIGPKLSLILLAEKGKLFDSPSFSSQIESWGMNSPKGLIFIIGGAKGHAPSILKRAQHLISLSPLTFPHQLARVIFVEQIYRAQTLQAGHPYHH